MAISDNKKVQSPINIVADEVDKLKAVATRLETLRTAFQAHNPDVTGTLLDGHVAQVSAWTDAARAVADDVVANAFLAERVPTHRGKAMGGIYRTPVG